MKRPSPPLQCGGESRGPGRGEEPAQPCPWWPAPLTIPACPQGAVSQPDRGAAQPAWVSEAGGDVSVRQGPRAGLAGTRTFRPWLGTRWGRDRQAELAGDGPGAGAETCLRPLGAQTEQNEVVIRAGQGAAAGQQGPWLSFSTNAHSHMCTHTHAHMRTLVSRREPALQDPRGQNPVTGSPSSCVPSAGPADRCLCTLGPGRVGPAVPRPRVHLSLRHRSAGLCCWNRVWRALRVKLVGLGARPRGALETHCPGATGMACSLVS